MCSESGGEARLMIRLRREDHAEEKKTEQERREMGFFFKGK